MRWTLFHFIVVQGLLCTLYILFSLNLCTHIWPWCDDILLIWLWKIINSNIWNLKFFHIFWPFKFDHNFRHLSFLERKAQFIEMVTLKQIKFRINLMGKLELFWLWSFNQDIPLFQIAALILWADLHAITRYQMRVWKLKLCFGNMKATIYDIPEHFLRIILIY